MNNQEKKAELRKYGDLNKAIDQKLEELARLKAKCTKVTTTLSDMPKGGNTTIEDSYVKMIDLDNEINAEIDRYINMRGEIEAAINTVEDMSLRTLLRHRYINGFTWERIAVEMHYDIDGKNVYKLHGKALSAVQMDTELHY